MPIRQNHKAKTTAGPFQAKKHDVRYGHHSVKPGQVWARPAGMGSHVQEVFELHVQEVLFPKSCNVMDEVPCGGYLESIR